MKTLLEISALRVRLKELESTLPTLGLMERCDAEDEILEIREQLGEFDRAKWNDNEECLNCGS